ncbi:hypothetical protein OO013_09255 [Mangrovivirga sp. M17]|uniref:Uncharacterized protein n=1 Tax=Mangrovivirga halotolerans TaxID=2993936 RepID=A0ABT3RRC9_9BACT|nr:hypothetical protein [Mangrovivirga halotolerans]MCX2744051.1 hypothetical protein [Mangrovivirga halotolerans]
MASKKQRNQFYLSLFLSAIAGAAILLIPGITYYELTGNPNFIFFFCSLGAVIFLFINLINKGTTKSKKTNKNISDSISRLKKKPAEESAGL